MAAFFISAQKEQVAFNLVLYYYFIYKPFAGVI